MCSGGSDWTQTSAPSNGKWYAIASDSTGQYLAAVQNSTGCIYTSSSGCSFKLSSLYNLSSVPISKEDLAGQRHHHQVTGTQ